MKRLALIAVVVCIVGLAARPTGASPLYGGYNGESPVWIELRQNAGTIGLLVSAAVGLDAELNWWVEVEASFLFFPYITTVILNYEVGGIVSTSLFVPLPWPVEVGADSTDLKWLMTRSPFFVQVIGIDSLENSWSEFQVPAVVGWGGDSKGGVWGWTRSPLPAQAAIKVGIGAEVESLKREEIAEKVRDEVLSGAEWTRAFLEVLPGYMYTLLQRLASQADTLRPLAESYGRNIGELPSRPPSPDELPLLLDRLLAENGSTLEELAAVAATEIFDEQGRKEWGDLLGNMAENMSPHLWGVLTGARQERNPKPFAPR
jgi:hypothetical protein